MTDQDKTVYKICREQAGYTQERAAELLNCSVRALARYEAGVVTVPDDIAYGMVRLYNSQFLAVEHLRQVSQIAADLLPKVDECDLQMVAIRAFNSLADIIAAQPERKLLRIAEDGVISPEERPVLDEIMDAFSNLAKVYTELRIAAEREEV